ncbi:MAG: T9SS type A sorting domain-containing protein [Bacteroidetes bacterium]|nr:T9SS type A sorting domain-containing protein [Bacteroidota bacterium]
MKKILLPFAICSLIGFNPLGTSYLLFSQPIVSIGHTSNFAGASASSVTITKPSGVQQNDFLLAHVSGRVISGFALLPPSNGWTLIRKLNTGSQFGSYCFYKIASASEPSTYTFTDSTGAMLYDKLGVISVWRGVDIISPINAEGDTIVNGSPHSAPSIITTVDSCMIVTLFSDGSGSTWTPPSGMTEEYDTAAAQSSWVSDACDYVLQPSMGSTGIKTATPSSNSLATAFIIALQPPSSPTNVSALSFNADVQIFPNPTSGVFQVRSEKLEVRSIEIYNVYGERVYSWNSGLVDSGKTNPPIHQSTIDLSEAPSGIYFLQLKTSEGIANKKIIISAE